MDYSIIKSLHIIFVVTWFAGLFYMFRLFVYHTEAARKTEPARSILLAQYTIMEKRLWYAIAWPSCMLALMFGTWLLVLAPHWLTQPWMHIKLLFVALLMVYQFYGQNVLKKIGEDPMRYNSLSMRLLNEVPTLILISVVFLVVMKSEIHWIWGTLSILCIAALMSFFVWQYKRKREMKEK